MSEGARGERGPTGRRVRNLVSSRAIKSGREIEIAPQQSPRERHAPHKAFEYTRTYMCVRHTQQARIGRRTASPTIRSRFIVSPRSGGRGARFRHNGAASPGTSPRSGTCCRFGPVAQKTRQGRGRARKPNATRCDVHERRGRAWGLGRHRQGKPHPFADMPRARDSGA